MKSLLEKHYKIFQNQTLSFGRRVIKQILIIIAILLKRIGTCYSGQQKIILGANAIVAHDCLIADRLCSGNVEQYYDKRKLVLFGEYIPFKASKNSRYYFRDILVKGERDNNIYLPKNFKASPMICFESIFDSSQIKNNLCKTDFILQISNDSWFGNYFGPSQHFKNSLLRSVESISTLLSSERGEVTKGSVNFNGEIMQKIDNIKGINYNIFKSPIVKECKPFLKITIILILLFYAFLLYLCNQTC